MFTRIINLIIHLKSNSLKQIPYIGTEILNFHCFATNMSFLFCKSIIPEDFKSAGPHLSFPGVKTRFEAFLQNIPTKRPLRVDLINDPFYCTCWHRFLLFWDLFRLCHMKSEAFHFAKSFQHGPKASKQLNYIVFNDFIDTSMSKFVIFQKEIENQF